MFHSSKSATVFPCLRKHHSEDASGFLLGQSWVSSWLLMAEEELGMWREDKRNSEEVKQVGSEKPKETVEKN